MERQPLFTPSAPAARELHGVRPVGGESVAYSLFLPASPPSAALLPLVVLTHGFMGTERHWAWLAPRLAALAGVAVFTHDMTSLLARPHEDAQRRNIVGLADHVDWLLAGGVGSAPPFDAMRVVLCGHSAGGAVAFEAAVELAARARARARASGSGSGGGAAVAAVVLLDAVPWPRTLTIAAERFTGSEDAAAPLLISLRSEPSAWNMHGEVLKLLRAAAAAGAAAVAAPGGQEARVFDALLVGSRHADPVRPRAGGTCVLSCLGLLGPPACADVYAELLLSVVEDVRALPPGGSWAGVAQLAVFRAAVDAYAGKGVIVRTAL